MIQANELRIGNWIKEKGRDIPIQVENIPTNHSINCFFAHSDFDLSEFEPILLTPELLEKCGFEIPDYAGNWKFKEYTIYENKRFLIGEKENIFYCYRQVDDDYYSGMWPKLSSLHQLQNLYFALTGTELEINLGEG